MIINGESRASLPANWNFGNFILHRFKQANPLDVCLVRHDHGLFLCQARLAKKKFFNFI